MTDGPITQVLVVDDDAAVREALSQSLDLADLHPVAVSSVILAKDRVSAAFPGVVVSDLRMPGRDGFDLLAHIRAVDADLPLILLTGHGDVPLAVEAMSAGAFDFLEKPCAPSRLIATVRRALEVRAQVLDDRRRKAIEESGDAAARLIFGRSALSEALRARVRSVARAGAEVLLTGPPGSGTSKIAEVIHMLSPAARHPFVKRPAAALDPAALGAALQAAGAGSLFLDEVGALSPVAQHALLDRLDSGAAPRVIASTVRDLAQLPGFSPDLAVRLDVMRVRIPSLAERREDIPVLFRHYVAQACEQAALPEPEIGADVIAGLMATDWPGNARSLMNAAMRFAMGLGLADRAPAADKGLAEQMAEVERALLIEALERAEGHATRAAEALKLPRKTFYDKLARHSIRAEDYRTA